MTIHDQTISPPKDVDALPTISIVTPCLNHVGYVAATMASVLAQGYPKLEYVVMDGGSDDGSVETIERHAASLAHWQSGPDGGQYAAINEGFTHTSGEVMAWINADDMYHPNALWTVAEIFHSFPEVEWLAGAATIYDPRGRTVYVGLPPVSSRSHYLSKDMQHGLQQESVFWRRSLWERAGGRLDDSLQLAADFELWLRFFRHARLHRVSALIGGFRCLQDRRSLRLREEYLAEVDEVVAREPVSREDRRLLRKKRLYEMLMRRTPISVRGRYRRLFAPEQITYDAETDRFTLARV